MKYYYIVDCYFYSKWYHKILKIKSYARFDLLFKDEKGAIKFKTTLLNNMITNGLIKSEKQICEMKITKLYIDE